MSTAPQSAAASGNGLSSPPGRELIAADALQRRIAELGEEITADYAGRRPLLVGVLKGAFRT